MIRHLFALIACVCMTLSASAASKVTRIDFEDGEITGVFVLTENPDFNQVRSTDKVTLDGNTITEADLEKVVKSGTTLALCDTADYLAFFSTHESKDGKTYYLHPDGVYRESLSPGPVPKQPKPQVITDTAGNTYMLGDDGNYRPCVCTGHQPGTPWPDPNNCGRFSCPANGGKPSAPACPNGRCPLPQRRD